MFTKILFVALLASLPSFLISAETAPATLPASVATAVQKLNDGRLLASYMTLDGGPQRERFVKAVRGLVATGNLAAIEEAAAFYRTRPYPKFRDGSAVLPMFYEGLLPARNQPVTSEVFSKLNALFRRWEKEFPASPTRPVAEAGFFVRYAWQARGSTWANQVTDEGWKLMGERIAEARRILDSSPFASTCPQSGPVRLGLVLGESNEHETAEAAFENAVTAHPEYIENYFSYAVHLLPRWGGEPGQLGAWAQRESVRNRSGLGRALYARLGWATLSRHNDGEELFGDDGFRWKELRPAFDDLLALFPDSNWNRFHFARIAVIARDKETAARVAKLLPPAAAVDPSQHAELARILRYAGLDSTLADAVTPLRERLLDFKTSAFALSPDGRTFAVGGSSGQLVLLDSATLTTRAKTELKLPAQALAFTSGGRALAVATGTYTENQPGELITFDTKNLTLLLPETQAVSFYPRSLRVHPNGTLYLAGGARKPRLLRVPPQAPVEEITWFAAHSHSLNTVAISPDGQEFTAYCNRGIDRLVLPSGELKVESRQELSGWVAALEYSLDGRRIAAVSREGKPSVSIWETASSDSKPALNFPSTYGNLLCLAWSPDSHWLAVGGEDGTITLHDTLNQQAPRRFGAHLSPVRHLVFTPTGDQFYSLADDQTIRLWPLDPQGQNVKR